MDVMDELPDDELWRRAARGQAECFGLLFERHERAVRSYCHRRTGSLDTADDLVSVVFLEAWRSRRDVDLTGDSLLPWFLAVAKRVVHPQWRSTLRHRAALARLPRETPSPDHADDGVSRLDDRSSLTRIGAGYRALRPHEQQVFELCVVEERSYADASLELGIPVGTVKSRLSRARSRLQGLSSAPPATEGR